MTSLRRDSGPRRSLGERGSTIPEILVTVGIIGLVLGTSVIGLNASYADLGSSSQTFVNGLRQARMNSVTRGAHFRVSWTSSKLTTRRLQDDDADGTWATDDEFDPFVQNLPAGISIATTSPNKVEFDTRGMIVPPSGSSQSVVHVTINGASGPNHSGGTMEVEIWPSGQIELASNEDEQ